MSFDFSGKVVFLLLISFFWAQGCQKFENQPIQDSNSVFSLNYRDSDPLSVQAYAEVVTNDYEEQGNLVYTHMKYRFATVTASDYIPAIDRNLILQTLNQFETQNQGKAFNQVLTEAVSAGLLTANEKTLLQGLKQTAAGLENNYNLTFGQAWYAIRNWELATIDNTSISEDEKTVALLVASGARNLMKYQHESGQIVTDRDNGCTLGRKTSCWIEALGNVAIGWIKAAIVKAQSSAGTNGPIEAFLIALIKKSVLTAGGIGLVLEVIKIYSLDRCKCDAQPAAPTCANPKGVSLMLGDCNQLEQYLLAWGHTSDGSSVFNWVIENGVFPDNNDALTITTISPQVRVRQNNENIPISIAVQISCAAPEYKTITGLSIPKMVNDPGTLSIFGPLDVSSTGGYTERYDFYGSWRISQNSVVVYSGCTPHGQVMEQGDDFIKIKWISTNPPYPTPKVTAIVRNACSEESNTQNLNVTIH